jgi:SAM-dependent methyltransferase
MVASYGNGNDRYLSRLVSEYKSMSFSVDVVVLSNLPKKVSPAAQVVAVDLRGRNPWSLPFAHKKLFADRIGEFDLFIYSEDDTLVRESNLRAFLEVSAVLPETEVPGFLRFEQGLDGRVNYPDVHGHFHWDPGSVRLRAGNALAVFTNEHAACYVLTRRQLQRAIDSGGFLVAPHSDKYDLLCTAATDPYTQCGMEKLICVSRLDDFLLHHLPNKYVGTSFGVSDGELRRQVEVLLRISGSAQDRKSLLSTETKLPDARYSKCYYEEVQPCIIEAIPASARTVLSVGCGWGATEAWLAEKDMRVTAVPLDAVIPGGAEAKGVEIVAGDFAEARGKLAGRQFDCLLLSNILHLVPDPVAVLGSFGELLVRGGVAIATVPNTAQLAGLWKAMRRKGRVEIFRGYEETGVQMTSRRIVLGWFRSAGMRRAGFRSVVGEGAAKMARVTFGVLDPWLATEFIAVGRRI